MEKHFKLSDSEFEKQFQSCKIDSEMFSHEAHLRLAWIHIKNYGVERAIANVQEQLKNFVEYLGAKDKYNITLIVSAVKAVHHFMLKSESTNFKDFISEYPRLKNNFKELLGQHYVVDIFNSKDAKTKFLEPDLLPS